MKITIAIFSLLCIFVSLSYAAGDATSKTESNDEREITTYQRDGTNILRRVYYKSNDSDKRILRQQILRGETILADVLDFQGKQSVTVRPNTPLTVISQHFSTGGLESVSLMTEESEIIEIYENTDEGLTPVVGRQLAQLRKFSQGFTDLVDAAESEKETRTEPAQNTGLEDADKSKME